MAKQGEIGYLAKLSAEDVTNAVRKPFSEARCPIYLMQMGAIMALLPPPPARLLDLGCGTGWTSMFFARRGYQVVGVDIAADMIYHANRTRAREELDRLEFVVGDYEDLDFADEFDCAVFYDSLHHAVDEDQALRVVYRALKPGGVCVTSEPGRGHAHSASSVEAVAKYNVTEKDMPPAHVMATAARAGFRQFRLYPNAQHLTEATYGYTGYRLRALAGRWPWVRQLGSLAALTRVQLFRMHEAGIVVMLK